jgi:hydrogenase maturation protease
VAPVATDPAVPGPRTVPLVLGFGNALRRDDGCGPAVVRAVRTGSPAGIEAVEVTGDPTGAIDAWEGRDLVIAVDAVSGDGPPGTIYRWDGTGDLPVRPRPRSSTHGLSLADLVALGRTVGRMPRRLIVFGIQVVDVRDGTGLSPEVDRSVREVVRQIGQERDRPPDPPIGARGTHA